MNHEKTPYINDTIVALATATGVGAISLQKSIIVIGK